MLRVGSVCEVPEVTSKIVQAAAVRLVHRKAVAKWAFGAALIEFQNTFSELAG